MHKTILGFLSQFYSLSRQGEVLCTQGLAFILGDPAASRAFSKALEEWTGRPVPKDLQWKAEAFQEEDGGRPDLEATTPDGTPAVKIEAKLGAALSEAQLRSYVKHLIDLAGEGILAVLVPPQRVGESTSKVEETFGVSGDAPWQPPDYPGIAITVVSWDDVILTLTETDSPRSRRNLEQLSEMVMVMTGRMIMPLTSEEDLINWRERVDQLIRLLDLTTLRLAEELKFWYGPFGQDTRNCPDDDLEHWYYRRYLCGPLGDTKPCFSVGVRHPFEAETTPIWLRFHRDTPLYDLIHRRLEASDLSRRLVISSGHSWYPLDIPLSSDAEEMIGALLTQVKAIVDIAYKTIESA